MTIISYLVVVVRDRQRFARPLAVSLSIISRTDNDNHQSPRHFHLKSAFARGLGQTSTSSRRQLTPDTKVTKILGMALPAPYLMRAGAGHDQSLGLVH